MNNEVVTQALSDAGLLSVVFQVLLVVNGVIMSICSFFVVRLIREFDSFKKEHKELKDNCPINRNSLSLDLAQFKMLVSKEYAKSSSIERLHDRIDKLGSDINQRTDKILTLLIKNDKS